MENVNMYMLCLKYINTQDLIKLKIIFKLTKYIDFQISRSKL